MNIERVVASIDRATRDLETPLIQRIREHLHRAQTRLQRELRPAYASNLGAATANFESRVFREARARALITQLDAAIQAIDVSAPGAGVSRVLQQSILEGTAEGARQAKTLIREAERTFGVTPPASLAPALDLRAIQAQVDGALQRLNRYSLEAIEKVNDAIVEGLVAGRNPTRVAYDVRTAITGDPRARELLAPGIDSRGRKRLMLRKGGLAFQAETIARTEMLSAVNASRMSEYTAAGVQHVVWIATPDEFVCEHCGGRSGRTYRLEDVIIPAHPRCRCTSLAVKKEWLDDGLITRDELSEHRSTVLRAYREEHGPDSRFATGPSAFERANGRDTAPSPVNL